MDFTLTDDQRGIRDAVLEHCSRFPDEYWLQRDHEGVFPHDFHRSMAESGWLGVAVPEDVGGGGLGITEAAIMMQAVAESGGGMTAASSVHGPVFGMQPVNLFGTAEQRRRMIPPVLTGEHRICFAVTEPDAGLDTTRLRTRAERRDGGYLVNGEKIWISVPTPSGRARTAPRTASTPSPTSWPAACACSRRPSPESPRSRRSRATSATWTGCAGEPNGSAGTATGGCSPSTPTRSR
ncbi:acyl-CoA dehydrogenase family protein [Actinomadura algeriensis]|uniref:acyl-CoA dehydrogenase family protein n=1 Tax=Actinomadura algeriensis TaxID=1679523 RepID=UPI00178BD2E0